MTTAGWIQIANIAVAVIAGIMSAMTGVLVQQKKTSDAEATTANASADVAFMRARTATQAVAEVIQKLPPPPPGGHGFTDSTQQFLLGLPVPPAQQLADALTRAQSTTRRTT